MATGDTMGYAAYDSDNGTAYEIKCSSVTASAGGLSGFSILPTDLPIWPYDHRDLRHVNGKSAGGKRASLIIGSADNALFVSRGGSFTIDAGTFTVLGSEGERRPASHIR